MGIRHILMSMWSASLNKALSKQGVQLWSVKHILLGNERNFSITGVRNHNLVVNNLPCCQLIEALSIPRNDSGKVLLYFGWDKTRKIAWWIAFMPAKNHWPLGNIVMYSGDAVSINCQDIHTNKSQIKTVLHCQRKRPLKKGGRLKALVYMVPSTMTHNYGEIIS